MSSDPQSPTPHAQPLQDLSISGILSPPPQASSSTSPNPDTLTPRSSLDDDVPESGRERISQLEHELLITRQEKEGLSTQYRTLLGKLTAMRSSLGEKLREDAEELDLRETSINTLNSEISTLQSTTETLRSELSSASQESQSLQNQLSQLRSQSDSSSSDVLSLTREMRELRGEMERLRLEREEWEGEAGRERDKRELMEEEMRSVDRREREGRRDVERFRDEMEGERRRATNLQEVLSEFQAAKDSELRQATSELETQLRLAATSLSEFKLRAANAETRLGEVQGDAGRSTVLQRELREKNTMIGKLRHEAVVNNEHLTEALRRLRKNSSDNNVDRRLVTNFLLAFLTTSRSDSKRFEMLSLLSTILSWNDSEREKAGLQRIGATASGSGSKTPTKSKGGRREERSAEEEAAMNESFSNLFVEFLLKEASQGQRHTPTSEHSNPMPSPPIRSTNNNTFSPPSTHGSNTPYMRPRGLSTSSNASTAMSLGPSTGLERYGPGQLPGASMGRKASYGLREAFDARDRGG